MVEIRQDIHERFVAIVARADAKLKVEQKAVERRLTAALDGDKHEGRPRGAGPAMAHPATETS